MKRDLRLNPAFQVWCLVLFCALLCWPWVADVPFVGRPAGLYAYLFGVWLALIAVLGLLSRKLQQ